MPSADQIANMGNVLRAYRTQVRAIVSKHKKTVKKAVEDVDRRKTERILKGLGKT
ncbi:MAG: hypothetical protein V1745_00390 [Patescibacteria group bacterium]